jgi:hypothetical protein
MVLSTWLKMPGYRTEDGLIRALRECGVAAASSKFMLPLSLLETPGANGSITAGIIIAVRF